MANYRAVAAVSKAISSLIERSCEGGEFSGTKCHLVHADLFANKIQKQHETSFTLLLYRVTPRGTCNNLPPRLDSSGRRFRPSLPVDVHYLLTPWAADAEKQQRLLGLGMRALEDSPVLPASFINDCTPERNVFRPEESVEIVPENLALPDLLGLWDKLKPELQTSVTYVARMVLIDSTEIINEGTYHSTHREWLARDLIGYGTVWGLRVLPEDGGSKGPRILVECGAALSPRGQLIHVSPAQCAYLNDWLAANRDAVKNKLGHAPSSGEHITLYAVLAYADCETDDVPLAGEPCRTEENLTASSRIKDHFKLQLRLAPPPQTEEEALRNFVKALAQVEVVSTPATTLRDFETAVRSSPISITSPPTSPPAAAPDTFDYLFPSSVTIPSDQVADYLRAAFRIWATDLRPRCRPEWLASRGACVAGETQIQHPAAEEFILLAKLDVPITVDAMTSPSRWSVASASAIQVDDRDRPYVLHLRMLQALLLVGQHPRPGGSLVGPFEFSSPPSASYGVVAAGLVKGDQTAVGPVIGGLRVVSVASGQVVFAFDSYQLPDSSFQYIVKVFPVSAPPATPVPTVRFLEFRPEGFVLRVTRGAVNVSVADLQSVPFMLDVSRIG